MLKKLQWIHALALTMVVGLVMVGCSRASKTDRHQQRAQTHFKAGDYDRAEIECMNVLRLDPTNQVALRTLGIMSYEQGRLLRAFALLNELKKATPDDPEVRVKLGRCLLTGGQTKEGRQEALFVLDRQPTNAEALLLLVDGSATTNELREAQQRLEKLRSSAGNTAGFHLALGSLQARVGDLRGAEAAFRQALALDAKSSGAHFALANLYALSNDVARAEAALKTAAELAPPRSTLRLRYADFKIASGDTAAGRKALEEISKAVPDYLPALQRLASLALAERRFHECDGILKSLLVRDPMNLDALLLLPQLRLAQGEPAKAIDELERVLKIYPRLPLAHYRLAVARWANNDLTGAARSLNEALALQSDFPEAVLLLAQLNVRRGDTGAAINSLTRLLGQRPTLTQAQLLLADAYRARGNLDQALQVYQNLGKLYPTNPEPALLQGLVLRQQGKNAEARKCLEQSLTLSPAYVFPLEQLVGLDIREKQYDAARGRLLKQAERDPKAPHIPYLLATVHVAQTNLDQAEAALRKALELAPDFRPASALLAQVYVTSHKQKEALDSLQQMVARNTNDLASWVQIAVLQSAGSNYTAAKAAYEKVLAVNPKVAPALNNLAWLCAEHLGELDRAYELARKARDLQPASPSYADTLGWVHYRRGEYAQALPLIAGSAEKLPEEPEVQYHLGMTHYMLGEEVPAKVALQKALLLGREGAWRHEAQEHLRILEMDVAGGGAAAVAELEKKTAQRPNDPVVLLRLAAAYERQADAPKAAATYERALKLNPNLASALVKLAQLQAAKLNNPAKALELTRKARALEPDDPVIAHTLGQLAYMSRDFPWALSLLQESARKLPRDSQVQADFAMAAYSMGQVSNALAAMQQVVAAQPPSPRLEEARTFVQLHALQSDRTQAVAAAGQVREILKTRPDYVPALMVQALIRETQNDFPAVRDVYERVVKQTPQFTPASKALALLYFERLNDLARAYDHALKAREAFPQDRQVARLLGLISYQRGEFSRAAQLLAESAPQYPTDGNLFYCLGIAQYKLKQSRESKEALTKALALAPNSPLAAEAKRLLAELK